MAFGAVATIARLAHGRPLAGIPGWREISVLPALACLLLGLALWWLLPSAAPESLARTVDLQVGRRRAGKLFASMGLLIGASYFGHESFGHDVNLGLGIEPGGVRPCYGEDPYTASTLALLGLAMLAIDARLQPMRVVAQMLALLAHLTSMVALVARAYGTTHLDSGDRSQMPVFLALTLLLLSAGVLFARPRTGLARLMTEDDAAGMTARRLFLASLVVPPLLGWLALWGQRAALYGSAEAMALAAVAGITMLFLLVLFTSLAVRRGELARQETIRVLEQGEQRFRQLAENVRDAFWMLDPAAGEVLYVSPRYDEIWGRPHQTLYDAPTSWPDTIVDEDRAQALLALRSLHTEDSYDIGFRIVRPDGAMRWIRNRGFAIRDADGRLTRIAGISEDLTERHLDEQRVQLHLARIGLLDQITRAIAERHDMDSVMRVVVLRLEHDLPADFAWVATCDPEPTELTVAACGLTSWAAAVELGLQQGATVMLENTGLGSCVDGAILDISDAADHDAPMLRGLAILGLRSILATPLRVGDQALGVLLVARRGVGSFSGGEGEFLRTLGEHVALAAHHARLYDKLQRAYDDLRATQAAITQQERLQALGQMASGIAHDINNALSPIVGYADLLLTMDKTLSPQSRNFVRTIGLAADDIAQIVGRLKEFYRQRDANQPLARVDPNRIVQQVIDLTRARWRDMPQQEGIVIEVRTDLQTELPPVRGIEAELREALTNLLLNAVDAMPRGGVITLRTVALAAHLAIDVQDTGQGMDAETLHHCLEPFYTTKGERGTGLGLAMVFGVMQRHDGDITVESERGVGTTMRLLLPVATGLLAPEAVELEASLPPLPRLRILCIDDEPLLRGLLQEMLEREGHDVEVQDGAHSGLAALLRSTALGTPFDIVITDLGMPYIDGREVARMVKAGQPKTGVILLTGWGTHLGPDDKLPAHVDVALAKPPKVGQVREALRKVLARGLG